MNMDGGGIEHGLQETCAMDAHQPWSLAAP